MTAKRLIGQALKYTSDYQRDRALEIAIWVMHCTRQEEYK